MVLAVEVSNVGFHILFSFHVSLPMFTYQDYN